VAPFVDKLLAAQVKHEQFSGAVLIAQGSQVLFSRGYGMANWDHQLPDTPHTRFYLGSSTKQFTAMAVLILQQRGKLHLQDSVCSYIAQCPPAWQPVSIRDLLTHTSGIPQLDGPVPTTTPQDWISRYDNVPLAFRAGAQFSYCNICYQLLGYVIEQAAGEPYSEFLQQAIFNPLHMQDTGFDPNALTLTNHAIGYADWQVKADPVDWFLSPDMSFLRASGLLYSTVEDLFRWDQALYTNVLIPQQLLHEAFTPHAVSQFAGSSYGYGWFITKSPVAGHRLVWHDGRVDGFRSYIGRYIDDHVTIIFLSNLASVDELSLAKTLEQVVFAHL
jgi:CubicO group peptidase (beta-lactamase class C family)